MTTENFDTWEQAVQVLRQMPQKHTFNTLEQWALAYATRCVERDRKVRDGLTRTEQAIRETENALSGQFQALEEETDEQRRYYEIESRR